MIYIGVESKVLRVVEVTEDAPVVGIDSCLREGGGVKWISVELIPFPM